MGPHNKKEARKLRIVNSNSTGDSNSTVSENKIKHAAMLYSKTRQEKEEEQQQRNGQSSKRHKPKSDYTKNIAVVPSFSLRETYHAMIETYARYQKKMFFKDDFFVSLFFSLFFSLFAFSLSSLSQSKIFFFYLTHFQFFNFFSSLSSFLCV